MPVKCIINFTGNTQNNDVNLDVFSYNFQVAELVRTTIEGHTAPVPAILEIPSKDHPYDPTKDSILRRAKGMFNPQDF